MIIFDKKKVAGSIAARDLNGPAIAVKNERAFSDDEKIQQKLAEDMLFSIKEGSTVGLAQAMKAFIQHCLSQYKE